ncbi:unnamed protein product [Polarella glacialis]|uniref:Protein xylosyltransferase n=2 Tax=Polarella glacialis TaxID=89957 RepID=A0A813IIK0_POLGL|nr:unnamed protein product [Polarella glacialis]
MVPHGFVLFLPLFLTGSAEALAENVLASVNASGDNFYARKRSARCYASERQFLKCCCREPDAGFCWSGGRDFLRCCSGNLARCEGRRRPQLHAMAFGRMSEGTAILAHSVLRSFGTPLLLFGSHRDREDLPYSGSFFYNDSSGQTELQGMAEFLIRKLLLTKELLDVLPPEDYVVYLDATDTLVQRGSRGDLLAAYTAVAERHVLDAARAGGPGWSSSREPAVFAGLQNCHPLQVWSDENLELSEAGKPWREVAWSNSTRQRVYGFSGKGPILRGGEEVCARSRFSGSLPYIDSGAWMGRVAGARHLFGLVAGAAFAEKAWHCMEALNLLQAWFPGLLVVDTEAEMFWTADLQLAARNGYVPDVHQAVTMVKDATLRTLCHPADTLHQWLLVGAGLPTCGVEGHRHDGVCSAFRRAGEDKPRKALLGKVRDGVRRVDHDPTMDPP